jgi:signal transduction histidine kinase
MFKPAIADNNYQSFLKSSKSIIDKMMTDVRHISHNLSPTTLTYYGLGFAIEEQCAIINQSGKVKIAFNNEAAELLEKLSLPVSTALYRVFEELLNNTIKHARAYNAILNFTADKNVLLIEYQDDGIGMDSRLINKGIGLHNIESRLTVINALHEITTSPGNGFFINIIYTGLIAI